MTGRDDGVTYETVINVYFPGDSVTCVSTGISRSEAEGRQGAVFWLCMENLGSKGMQCCWCSQMSQGEEGRALYQSVQLLHIFALLCSISYSNNYFFPYTTCT